MNNLKWYHAFAYEPFTAKEIKMHVKAYNAEDAAFQAQMNWNRISIGAEGLHPKCNNVEPCECHEEERGRL